MTRGRGLQTGLGAARGGGAGTPAGSGKKPCYFFNHGGCNKAQGKCRFEHVKVSDAEKAKMQKPPPRSLSPPPSGGSPSGAGGGNPARAGGGQTKISYCFDFAKGGTCPRDPCPFPHIPQAEVDRVKAAAKAKATAKAEPKTKAKAKAQPATRLVPVGVAIAQGSSSAASSDGGRNPAAAGTASSPVVISSSDDERPINSGTARPVAKAKATSNRWASRAPPSPVSSSGTESFDTVEHLKDCYEAGVITIDQYRSMLKFHRESIAMLGQAGSN